jgi:hypothetical protein
MMVATRMRDTAFKHVLRTMPLGTAVKIEGPSGDLTLPDNFTRASVFLAGGIGITPFRSMICLAAAERLPHQIFLFYSNRRPEDAPFLDELQGNSTMRSHTTVGGEIFAKSKFPVLQLAREIALYHHERWDGMGYPQRLKGEHIPLSARIVAVVDTFDALTQGRPYKKAASFQDATKEIRAQAGQQFDPQVVKAFLSVVTPQTVQDLINLTEINLESTVQALARVP